MDNATSVCTKTGLATMRGLHSTLNK